VAPARVGELVSQVDLAPTLLDYAGAPACPPGRKCDPLDGRSLRGLVEGQGDWPQDRAIPLTLDDGWSYEAMRTEEELYMEVAASRKQKFTAPERELYELRSDPDQLDNLAVETGRDWRTLLGALSKQLAELTDCAGIEGRDRARGRPFCR
jgi:arylsulfatase A-like enzyme